LILPPRSQLTCTPRRRLLQARHSLSTRLLERQAHLLLAAAYSAPTVPLRQSALRLRSRGQVSPAWTVLCSPRPRPRHHSSRKQAAISLRSPWTTMMRSCDYGPSNVPRLQPLANRDVFSSPRTKRAYRNLRSRHPDDVAESATRAQRARLQRYMQRSERTMTAPIGGFEYSLSDVRPRQVSQFSQNSARTASTEHSLWEDPDLEGQL
jgi:hypothetical protein